MKSYNYIVVMRRKATPKSSIKSCDRKLPYFRICIEHSIGLKDYRTYSDHEVRMSEIFMRYLKTEPINQGLLSFTFYDRLGFPCRNLSLRFSEMLNHINSEL